MRCASPRSRPLLPSLPSPLVALGALALSGCIVHVYEDHDAVELEPCFDRVVVELDAGDVTFTAGDVEAVTLDVRYRYTGDHRPELEAEIREGTLYVEADCDGARMAVCAVDIEAELPWDRSVEVETGAGDVAITGSADTWVETGAGDVVLRNLSGLAWVDTGAGSVETKTVAGSADIWSGSGSLLLSDIEGPVWADTGSGAVEASGLSGATAYVSTGSGAVEVEMVDAFEQLLAETGVGDIELTVPTGDYRLDVSTGVGDVDLWDVGSSSDATAIIEANTGAGDIEITGR